MSAKEFYVSRGNPSVLPSKAIHYYGTKFPVRFYVTKPVKITQVSFFGPCLETGVAETANPKWEGAIANGVAPITLKTEFKVSIYDDTERFDEELAVLDKLRTFELLVPTHGSAGKTFLVELPEPVFIPAATMIDFKFEIKEESRDMKFYNLGEKYLAYQSVVHGESGAEFVFLTSSKQTAGFAFQLAETQLLQVQKPTENERIYEMPEESDGKSTVFTPKGGCFIL